MPESNWQIHAAVNAVRGFLEREVARDTGYFANLQLYSPNQMGKLFPGEGNLRGLLFYDIARAANNPLAGDTKEQVSIPSMGTGVRWNIQRDFNMRFDLTRAMDEGGSKKTVDLCGHISVYSGFLASDLYRLVQHRIQVISFCSAARQRP
ncbi:MAG: hypothetical protein Q8O58_07945 [Gallionella sp.]|nr:hypothetical protein [Gallionella sp.]